MDICEGSRQEVGGLFGFGGQCFRCACGWCCTHERDLVVAACCYYSAVNWVLPILRAIAWVFLCSEIESFTDQACVGVWGCSFCWQGLLCFQAWTSAWVKPESPESFHLVVCYAFWVRNKIGTLKSEPEASCTILYWFLSNNLLVRSLDHNMPSWMSESSHFWVVPIASLNLSSCCC